MTALVFLTFVGTALLWRLGGPYAETRSLTPIGRAVYPFIAAAGFIGMTAVIAVPL